MSSNDMATVTLNGKTVQVRLPCTLGQLLAQFGWRPTQVVVEHNGQVVPRTKAAAVGLAAGDRLEVIMPVAGG